MYELIQVSRGSYYIQSPARIGLVRTGESEVCLIDSGNDKDAGKKVKRILDANGWTLRAIFNTHSHADHIGGNRYLQTQTGGRIYAAGIERDFTAHPILEPAFLFGGDPPGALRHKFLMAQESDVLPLTEDVLPAGWQCLPLPGHSFDMVGFRTADGVVYLADALSSEETLEKYRIGFLYDPEAYIRTLETVKAMAAECFVPAHAEAAREIAPLAEKNIAAVHEIAEKITELCAEPVGFDVLLKRLFAAYGLAMTAEQHALVGCTVRSYLSWLTDTGRLQMRIEDGLLVWEAAPHRP